jgi:hypothetical protein
MLEEVVELGPSGTILEWLGTDLVRASMISSEVSATLVQDRGCFAREPSYHYPFEWEFEE